MNADDRPTLTIIDPADGPGFLRATVIGLGTIWGVGLLAALQQPIGSAGELLRTLGHWWGGTVIPSLWWPGVLVVGYGFASWARRRWPEAESKPHAGGRSRGSRAAMVLAVVAILLGVLVLIEPRWLLDLFYRGRAAPAAYEAFTYTDSFLRRQAPYVLVLVLVHVPMMITSIVSGRWSSIRQRSELGLALVTCAVLTWIVLDGPVFLAPGSDQLAKSLLVLIVAFTLLDLGVRLRRTSRPATN